MNHEQQLNIVSSLTSIKEQADLHQEGIEELLRKALDSMTPHKQAVEEIMAAAKEALKPHQEILHQIFLQLDQDTKPFERALLPLEERAMHIVLNRAQRLTESLDTTEIDIDNEYSDTVNYLPIPQQLLMNTSLLFPFRGSGLETTGNIIDFLCKTPEESDEIEVFVNPEETWFEADEKEGKFEFILSINGINNNAIHFNIKYQRNPDGKHPCTVDLDLEYFGYREDKEDLIKLQNFFNNHLPILERLTIASVFIESAMQGIEASK